MKTMEADRQKRIVNHCRISQLLNRGAAELHSIFREKWECYRSLNNTINSWNDDEGSGKELIQLLPSSTAQKIRDLLKDGRTALWDITLTNMAIQAVTKELKKRGTKLDKMQMSNIDALREIRNDAMHGKSELTDDEFVKFWDQLVKVLCKFGVDNTEIETFKTMTLETSPMDKRPEFKKLKDKANEFFKTQKYKEAIEVYNEILEFHGLLPDSQALIFSNRSAAYLLLKDENSLKMAERDAEWAVQLWPCWWKGYYRLGRAQAAQEKWQEAEKTLNKALALNSCKEVFHELSTVRQKIGIASRQEHLNPAQQPKSMEEQIDEIVSRMGISKAQAKKLWNKSEKIPGFGDIIRGHHFRDGTGGVQQDYFKAATYYGKAAAAGQAEAMYNLGQLYHHGRGVPKDFEQSMYWLLKAAEAKPLGGPRVGSGVPEAQHLIGIKYSEGIGVKKDYSKAAEWYEKAVKNDLCASANNLGLLYQNGQGVVKSATKAFEYFKVSAKLGDTAGMQNLAGCYFSATGTGSIFPSKQDIAEGMKWLSIAASKGDLVAAQELEMRQKMTSAEATFDTMQRVLYTGTTEFSDPLDQDQYGKKIKDAAKNGSEVAQRHLDIWKNMNIAMNAFKKRDNDEVVASLAKAIRLDFQVVEVPEIFHQLINARIKSHPNDLDSIVCYLRINSKNSNLPSMTDKYLQVFPSDEFLLEVQVTTFIAFGKLKEALKAANKAIKIYPKSSRFLYCRAIALCLQDDKTPESITALDAFLAVAPKDHDKVPACYYRKAFYYGLENEKKFIESYEAGTAAEKHQLPCFLPYDFPRKSLLDRLYMMILNPNASAAMNDTIAPVPSTNSNLQKIKSSVQRKLLISSHRKAFIHLQDGYQKSFEFALNNTVANLPNQPKPPRLISLKEITLKEMNPTIDKTYDGFVLEGRVLEWSYLMTGIFTIIEDKNGDVERITLYNWPKKSSFKEDFIEGLKVLRPNVMVSIINPYMRMAQDGKSLIRIESPDYIKFDNSMIEKCCNVCGKEAKVLPCSKCMMARYCSKECQKVDWVEFNHKDLCPHLKPLLPML